MKILLVGEYSRLHNSLKEGLLKLGHEVAIVGCGDNFKNYPVDFSVAAKTFSGSILLKFFNKFFRNVLRIDLEKLERAARFRSILPLLKNYDVVQLINSDALEIYPLIQIKLFKKLFAQNRASFLLICGEDTPIVDILLKNNLKSSVLTPLFADAFLKPLYQYTLKYSTLNYRKLYNFVATNCNAIITSDLDYKLPMEQTQTKCHFVPNPINVDVISFIDNPIADKIVIFHGINHLSAVKKGNKYFESALNIIKNKYKNQVEIIVAQSLPYSEYINLYNKAHILLDQVYGYDQGYNALEAMAKGKVVFTGAETEFEEHYNLKEKVAFNATPNVETLVNQLEYLINNSFEINKIGKNARLFIEKEHHYIKIAQQYIDIWQNKKAT
jgi:glycosyltransferase involved in cell wall biosynthesis